MQPKDAIVRVLVKVPEKNTDDQKQAPRKIDNPYQLIFEIFKLLGRAAPVLLIAAGAVFGFLEYKKLSQDRAVAVETAIRKARTEYEAQLKATEAKNVENTGKIANLVRSHIDNSERLIKLQKTTFDRMLHMRNQTREAQIRKTESELKATIARKELKNRERELDQKEEAINKGRGELEQEKRRLRQQQKRLGNATAVVSDLKKQLKTLATAYKNDHAAQYTAAGLRVAKLAREILVDGQAIPQQFRKYLAEFPQHKGRAKLPAKQFVGIRANELERHLRQIKSYKFWIKTKPRRKHFYIVGALTSTKRSIDNVVEIEIDNGKVTSFRTFKQWCGLTIPSLNNWYVNSSLVASIDGVRWKYVPRHDSTQDKWRLSNRYGSAFPILGREAAVSYMSLDEFAAKDGALYKKLVALFSKKRGRRISAPSKIFAIYVKSRTFNPTTNSFPGLVTAPKELRETFVSLAHSAIKGRLNKADKAKALALVQSGEQSESLAGRFASIVLRPHFIIKKLIQIPVAKISQRTNWPSDIVIDVICEYGFELPKPGQSAKRAQRIRLRFQLMERTPITGSGAKKWVLTSIRR